MPPHSKKTPKSVNTHPTSGGVQKTTRTHVPRSEGSAVLAGHLGDAIEAHAYERCRHFFLYVTTIKAIEELCNLARPTQKISALAGLVVKATEQIDSGFIRDDEPEYQVFDNNDASVVDGSATAFSKTDAAHYCNLGIAPNFLGGLVVNDPMVTRLYQSLVVYAGNTRQLPKRVNIGPDRKIDVLHGQLATRFLKAGAPVLSPARIGEYIREATLSLTAYALAAKKAGKFGVEACTKPYLAAYLENGFAERVYNGIYPEVWHIASAIKLPPHLVAKVQSRLTPNSNPEEEFRAALVATQTAFKDAIMS